MLNPGSWEQKCAEKKIVYEAGKNYIEKNRNVNFSFYNKINLYSG